jgi:hypothetical protein
MTNPAFATGSGYPPNPKEKFGAVWLAVSMIATALLLAWLFSGCCASPQTIIEQRNIDTTPPHFRDSVATRDSIVYRLVARDSVVKKDSVVVTYKSAPFHIYTGSKITDRGDTLKGKFDSYTNTIFVDIGYAKQSTAYQDTTQLLPPPTQKTFTEKVELWLFPVLCGALFACCIIVGFPIALKFIKPL